MPFPPLPCVSDRGRKTVAEEANFKGHGSTHQVFSAYITTQSQRTTQNEGIFTNTTRLRLLGPWFSAYPIANMNRSYPVDIFKHISSLMRHFPA